MDNFLFFWRASLAVAGHEIRPRKKARRHFRKTKGDQKRPKRRPKSYPKQAEYSRHVTFAYRIRFSQLICPPRSVNKALITKCLCNREMHQPSSIFFCCLVGTVCHTVGLGRWRRVTENDQMASLDQPLNPFKAPVAHSSRIANNKINDSFLGSKPVGEALAVATCR